MHPGHGVADGSHHRPADISAAGSRVPRLVFANTAGISKPELTAEMVANGICRMRDADDCTVLPDGHVELARYPAALPRQGGDADDRR